MYKYNLERHKSGIYIITNLMNGKMYVGSSKNIYNRYHAHLSRLKNNKHISKHLQSSYNKYGIDNFIFEVIEYCDQLELANREQYYIDGLNPEYNKRLDATSNINVLISSQAKEKISKSLKDKYKSGIIKAYRQNHNWRPVLQYDLEGNFIKEWDCIADAEKFYKTDVSAIGRACRDLFRISLGYYWRYKIDNNYSLKINIENYKKLILEDIRSNKIKRFYNTIDLIKDTGFSKTSVFRCLKSKKLYKKQFKIYYYEDKNTKTVRSSTKLEN